MQALILNDTHLGFARKGGTTQHSAEALHDYLYKGFEEQVMAHTDKVFIHGGDLFDSFEATNLNILRAFNVFVDFIENSKKPLYLLRANHDWHPSGSKVSAWDMMARILKSIYPERVNLVYGEFASLYENVYAIGHCANQALFDFAMDEAVVHSKKDTGYKWLILHANYDNPFAEQADHSLNVSASKAHELVKAGYKLVFAHEHQARYLKFNAEGKTSYCGISDADVVIMGNQLPSSVSDCLSHGVAQAKGVKNLHILSEDKIEAIPTWEREGSFIRVDWSELNLVSKEKFIRVEGNIEQSQVDEVFSVIQRFRNKSDAYIITNAVKIEGMNALDEEEANISIEDIKTFDIMGEFLKLFTAEEQKTLEKIME